MGRLGKVAPPIGKCEGWYWKGAGRQGRVNLSTLASAETRLECGSCLARVSQLLVYISQG